MPIQTFYNVFHEPAMSWLIVVYFILIGISSGTFMVSSACRFWAGERFDKIERIGALLAAPLLAGGLLFLLLDLGKPFRFWRMIIHFNPTSVASWGIWLMSIFFVVTLLYAYFSWIQDEEKRKKLAMVGSPLAVAVALYSGIILLQMKAYDLWHSAIIPMLFFVSAVISGIALVVLVAILTKVEKDVLRRLGIILRWAIVIDLVLVAVKLFSFFLGHHEAVEIARLILVGAYAPVFLGLYIFLGLIVPLFILIRKAPTIRAEAIASVLVLIGTLAIRYVIVMGGQYYPLS